MSAAVAMPQKGGAPQNHGMKESVNGHDLSDASDDGESHEDSTDYSSDEEAGQDPDSQISSAYRKLLSRRVDLVGDYAGDELFLIEGDSLLLNCFDDDKLDFNSGCQTLHAAYNVERFLQNLVQRKCNFNLVFFDSNRELCVPQNANQANASKYYFSRAAIIRHLQVNLSKTHPDIGVEVFSAWTSKDFLDYLDQSSPYFVMAHDGAQAVDRKAKHIGKDSGTAQSTAQRVALRQMILFFANRGRNVALVNGIDFRDTKVMTMIVEIRQRADEDWGSTHRAQPSETSPTLDVSGQSQKLHKYDSKITERVALAVVTLCQMLQGTPSTGDAQQWKDFCATFLLHSAILQRLPLSERRVGLDRSPEKKLSEGAQKFLRAFCSTAERILRHTSWAQTYQDSTTGNVLDIVDGRLFLYVLSTKPQPNDGVQGVYRDMAAMVEAVANIDLSAGSSLPTTSTTSTHGQSVEEKSRHSNALSVLPFSNKVFDKHLESVHIDVDADTASEKSLASRKVFQEVSHWHNAKKPLVRRTAPTPQEEKQAKWAAKKDQRFMAEMTVYAASLTNAVGKSLEPESIIVGAPKAQLRIGSQPSPADSEASDSGASTASKNKAGGKKPGGGGKNAAKNAGKQAMLNQIAATKAKKDESASDKIISSWQVVCKGFEADQDPRAKYRKAKEFRINLQLAWREVIGPECELYMLSCLLQYWIGACKRKEQSQRIQVVALIWSHVRSIVRSSPLPKSITNALELTVKTLSLPPMPKLAETTSERRLAFAFALPTMVESLAIKLSSKEFQLLECGPYLERSFDSRPDPRVEFQPDGWQRKVLDGIDADQSVFVVAPTSAGKTFISFYAMRKILEADDDSVLVYVAPTKALVNQIAAEIQARYSKKFKYGGRSVWAIHTRDYRINNPTGCQVLVTVPHVLQIMLLAPSNASSWSSRVKRIIFDEIHSIGQAEDGVVWEQLLLMAPCPIIALSATVGNPNEFSDWLATTQEAIGKELVTVQHPFRYSDLRKYFFNPPQRFVFRGVPEKVAFGNLGLEGLPGFNYVHPVAALVDRSRGIPEDLALEPRDCLYLWQAMTKVQTEEFSVPAALDPAKALPDVSRKVDILTWEKALKQLLKTWLEDSTSPYSTLVQELEKSFRNKDREPVYATYPSGLAASRKDTRRIPDAEDVGKTTLPLLCRLQEQDALPAILFNYDRHQCEKICRGIVETLQSAELAQKKSGPKWEKTLERWEEWKEQKDKASSRAAKSVKKATKKSKDEDADADKASKLDMQKESAGGEDTKWESFDPEAPADGFHFADHTRAQLSETEIYIRQLRYREIQPFLIEALKRGVGVHHAGMNRKYRQIVEILFRKGFIRVVVATGTLALGINMPCKTVIFSGDSVFLTALNYRQCAGRAGRRGFDLLGNVVFQGLSRQKVCRLISSRLPDLNGHFPITTTLVLRLFTLLHESHGARYATSAINALLSQPRLYLGGPSFKDQTMHHLRFSIEYLRRQQLLGSDGAPLNFAGLVSHLYFTENSSFAFHALLKEGYFHELCAGIVKSEKTTLETLMMVMAHLFNRVVCRQADVEFREKVVKPSSSIVFLPPMPKKASQILIEHNQQTLGVYKAYVETFVDQHIQHADNKLPLSGMQAGAEKGSAAPLINNLPPTRIRSPFVALSGAGDDFDTIHDLCRTTRDGVFLEEAVIPHMDVYPEEMNVPLNAWLLDFYKHGDVMTIERANGIRRADIWFFLNDFSLVLATIITSMMNFMKLVDGSDMDMLEVMGNMDAHEEEEDDKVAAVEQESEVSGPSAADSGIVMPDRTASAGISKKKAKNADSWEDLADEEDKIARTKQTANVDAGLIADAMASWDDGGEGLKNILKAFQKLHAEFNTKFKAMWA